MLQLGFEIFDFSSEVGVIGLRLVNASSGVQRLQVVISCLMTFSHDVHQALLVVLVLLIVNGVRNAHFNLAQT